MEKIAEDILFGRYTLGVFVDSGFMFSKLGGYDKEAKERGIRPMTSFFYLDSIRENANDEFRENGLEVDFDDYDSYRAQLRGHNMTSTILFFNGVDANSEQRKIQKGRPGLVLPSYKRINSRKNKTQVCVFCKNSKKPAHVYNSHVLKSNTGVTSCPILRKYKCPMCGATGDNGHTIKYCPLYDGISMRVAVARRKRSDNKKSPY